MNRGGGPRDLSVSEMMNEKTQREEMLKQVQVAPFLKYLELILKVEYNPETASFWRFRMNRVCDAIERMLGMPDKDEDR